MLKYQWLGDFDEDMVHLTKENRIFDQRMADLLLMKAPEQTLPPTTATGWCSCSTSTSVIPE